MLFASGCLEQVYISAAPDGTIALCYEGKLFRISPDLTTAEVVSENIIRAEYSPDGSRLFCVIPRETDGKNLLEFAICDLDGKVTALVDRLRTEPTDDFESQVFTPRWSPDGRFVSYLKVIEDTGDPGLDIGPDVPDLFIKEVNGPYQIVIPNVAVGYSWSPDAKEVAVISGQELTREHPLVLGSVQVWNVEAAEKVSEPAGLLFNVLLKVSFSPDGSRLFFSSHAFNLPLSRQTRNLKNLPLRLFSVDREGKMISPALPGMALGYGIGGSFDISPDGAQITCVSCLGRMGRTLSGRIVVFDSDTDHDEERYSGLEIAGMPRWLSNERWAYVILEEHGDKVIVWLVRKGDNDTWGRIELRRSRDGETFIFSGGKVLSVEDLEENNSAPAPQTEKVEKPEPAR
jgi:Tol biopolymer transport system component